MEVQQPGETIALARARRSFELGRLPGWGAALTPQAWQRLRGCEARLSSGTLVAIMRAARQQGQIAVTKSIFLVLLQRIEVGNAFWARRSVGRLAEVVPDSGRALQEDLRQELTLHLWEEMALRDGEGWELFFRRSLSFARAQVARRALARYGYRPGQQITLFFSHVAATSARADHGENDTPIVPALIDPQEPFTASDLADLRGYVERLPPRERAVVVMRAMGTRSRTGNGRRAWGDAPHRAQSAPPRQRSSLHALYRINPPTTRRRQAVSDSFRPLGNNALSASEPSLGSPSLDALALAEEFATMHAAGEAPRLSELIGAQPDAISALADATMAHLAERTDEPDILDTLSVAESAAAQLSPGTLRALDSVFGAVMSSLPDGYPLTGTRDDAMALVAETPVPYGATVHDASGLLALAYSQGMDAEVLAGQVMLSAEVIRWLDRVSFPTASQPDALVAHLAGALHIERERVRTALARGEASAEEVTFVGMLSAPKSLTPTQQGYWMSALTPGI